MIAREQLMPQVLQEARKNLKDPPKIYTEIALEQIDGSISFFQEDLPAGFADATDAPTKAAFAKSNAAVIQALKDYAAWMKSDLLPRSNGDFRFGADTFRKKLAYDEMVDTPPRQPSRDWLRRPAPESARVRKGRERDRPHEDPAGSARRACDHPSCARTSFS